MFVATRSTDRIETLVKQATLIFVLAILLVPSTMLAQSQPLDKPVVSVQVDTAIHLSWGAVPNATNYEVWVWDEQNKWQMLTDNHSRNQVSHINFVFGRDYWYAVRAKNETSHSEWSDYVSATAPVARTPTPTPTPASATSTPTPAPASIHEVSSAPTLTAVVANGAIQLSWGAVDHAQNYEIWRWFAGEWEFIIATSHLSHLDSNVNAGNTYYYAIAGLNTNGNRGPWSGYANATVPADTSNVMPTPTDTDTPTPSPTPTKTPSPTPTLDPNPERAALVALFNATDGANWVRNTNWLTDTPLSRWHEVSTDANGNVVGLTLFGNNLRGSIPPELGNLTNLRSLVLDTNELSGPIPKELGKLTNLTQLRLYNNNLTGEIPSEVASLPNLTDIALDNDQESLITLGMGWGGNMRAMKRVSGVIVVATNGVSNLAIDRVVEVISGMLTNRPDVLTAMADYRTKVILRTVNWRGNPGHASYAPNTNAEYPIIRVTINAQSGGLSSMPKPSCGTTIHEIAHAIHYSFIESQGCCAPSAPSPPGSQQPPSSHQGMNPAQAFDGQLQSLYATAMANGLWAGQYAATNHYEYWAVTVPIWLGLGQFTLADYDPNLAALIEGTLGEGAYVPEYCQ